MSWVNPWSWNVTDHATISRIQSMVSSILWLAGGAAGRKAQFAANLSSSASIPNGLTQTTLKFDAVTEDTDNGYNSGNGVYTVSQAGSYIVSASVTWPNNTTGIRFVAVTVSTGRTFSQLIAANVDSLGRVSLSKRLRLPAGATVQVQVSQNSGSAMSPTTGQVTSFELEQIGL